MTVIGKENEDLQKRKQQSLLSRWPAEENRASAEEKKKGGIMKEKRKGQPSRRGLRKVIFSQKRGVVRLRKREKPEQHLIG